MRPEKILPWLLGSALGAAGLIQGWHWRSVAPRQGADEAEGRITALENEIALLKRENESLRSLAQGGGEVNVDPATIDFVEQALGMDFRSSPQIHRIAGEELRDRIVASIEARYGPHGMDLRQQAWSFMGLLNSEDRFASQLAAMKAVGARSWFDEQSGEGWVTDRFDPQSVPDQAALIRALTRILIHQSYPPAPGWPGDEAAISREAIQHGTAMAVENRFLARQALASGFTGAQDNADARALIANLPVFVRGIATFPSLYGLPRAERLMDQEEILSGLHRPPPISADFFPEHEELEANPPALPGTPGNMLLEESVGMLGLRLWLEPLGEEFVKLPGSWRGDRYRVHSTSDMDVHLIWEIRLDSPEAADALLKAGLSLVSAQAGTEQDPQPGELVTTPEERHVLMRKSAPDVVRFINASSKDHAELLSR